MEKFDWRLYTALVKKLSAHSARPRAAVHESADTVVSSFSKGTENTSLSFIRSVLHSFNTTPTSVTSDWWIPHKHTFMFVWNISAPQAGSEQVQTSSCLMPLFYASACLSVSCTCLLSFSRRCCWNLSALSQENRITVAPNAASLLDYTFVWTRK